MALSLIIQTDPKDEEKKEAHGSIKDSGDEAKSDKFQGPRKKNGGKTFNCAKAICGDSASI